MLSLMLVQKGTYINICKFENIWRLYIYYIILYGTSIIEYMYYIYISLLCWLLLEQVAMSIPSAEILVSNMISQQNEPGLFGDMADS